MAISDADVFGRCACTGQIELTWVQVSFTRPAGDLELVPDVPRGMCQTCGSAYYKAWTLQALERMYKAAIR